MIYSQENARSGGPAQNSEQAIIAAIGLLYKVHAVKKNAPHVSEQQNSTDSDHIGGLEQLLGSVFNADVPDVTKSKASFSRVGDGQ